MKIVSFNILHCMNYLTKKIDFPLFGEEINSFDADIIGLNEVRGRGFIKDYSNQLKKLSSLTGLGFYFGKAISVGGLAPYGNGLMARGAIKNAQTIKIPDPEKKTGSEMYESRCIIKALVGKYTVIVTHMGLNRDERESAVKTILENAPDTDCIIMGDFNCTPDAPEIRPLTEKFRCVDTEALTFPSDEPRIKIDYILLSKDIKIKNHGVSHRVVSDHLAHFVEIED